MGLDDDTLEWVGGLYRAHPAPPEVAAVVGPAVFLVGGMGNAVYLALDGRLVGWGAEGLPPAVIDDPGLMTRAIVIAAHELRRPGLLALRPPAPEGVPPCPVCDGCGWDAAPAPSFDSGHLCFICAGRGWMKPRG